MKFRIKAQHTVVVTYIIEAPSFKEAHGKLCDKDIFCPTNGWGGSPRHFEISDRVMRDIGASVEEVEVYGDPAPTGKEYLQRDWEGEAVCSQCLDPLTYEQETARTVCKECLPVAPNRGYAILT